MKRNSKEKHLTLGRARVASAERAAGAEAEVRERLKTSHDRFLTESDPVLKDEAGKSLIRAIFGTV